MSVSIEFIGHAGFVFSTHKSVIVMDPWLSSHGAYDASWFQYPCNHHLADSLVERLEGENRKVYVYVSHEHQDHYDIAFLKRLPESCYFVLPKYSTQVFDELQAWVGKERIRYLRDARKFKGEDFELRLYLDDSGINRDSGILIKSGERVFLNLNDCKIIERLREIGSEYKVTTLATQFSGATWHPTCYDYSTERYREISRLKKQRKFQAVLKSLAILQPESFLPSAGPCCFLDPELYSINFEQENIFPRNAELVRWLRDQPEAAGTKILDLGPGDRVALESLAIERAADSLVAEQDRESYLQAYQARLMPLFEQRGAKAQQVETAAAFLALGDELQKKLDVFQVHDMPKRPLYVCFDRQANRWWRVDFQSGQVRESQEIAESEFYEIQLSPWQSSRVVEGKLSWEELCLSFRPRLRRMPDHYDTATNLFLFRDADELPWATEQFDRLAKSTERFELQAGAQRYSVRRYCPHQGADLKEGWVEDERYLICPRHQWRFDLQDSGQTSNKKFSVMAQPCNQDSANCPAREMKAEEQAEIGAQGRTTGT